MKAGLNGKDAPCQPKRTFGINQITIRLRLIEMPSVVREWCYCVTTDSQIKLHYKYIS